MTRLSLTLLLCASGCLNQRAASGPPDDGPLGLLHSPTDFSATEGIATITFAWTPGENAVAGDVYEIRASDNISGPTVYAQTTETHVTLEVPQLITRDYAVVARRAGDESNEEFLSPISHVTATPTSALAKNLVQQDERNLLNLRALVFAKNAFIARTDDRMVRSTDGGRTWYDIPLGSAFDLAVTVDGIAVAQRPGGLWFSGNAGADWTPTGAFDTGAGLSCAHDCIFFSDNKRWISNTTVTQWAPSETNLGATVQSIARAGDKLVASYIGYTLGEKGLATSSDAGVSWTKQPDVTAEVASDGVRFVMLENTQLSTSDDGVVWTKRFSDDKIVGKLGFSGGVFYASYIIPDGRGSSFILSDDGGLTWTVDPLAQGYEVTARDHIAFGNARWVYAGRGGNVTVGDAR